MKFPGGNGILLFAKFWLKNRAVRVSGSNLKAEARLVQKQKPRLRKIQWRSFNFLVTVW